MGCYVILSRKLKGFLKLEFVPALALPTRGTAPTGSCPAALRYVQCPTVFKELRVHNAATNISKDLTTEDIYSVNSLCTC